jgi:hypothetical protein
VTLLLQRIKRDRKLAPADQESLQQTIGRLERDFFAEANGNGEKVDLRKLTEDWIRKISWAHVTASDFARASDNIIRCMATRRFRY